MYIRVVNFPEI